MQQYITLQNGIRRDTNENPEAMAVSFYLKWLNKLLRMEGLRLFVCLLVWMLPLPGPKKSDDSLLFVLIATKDQRKFTESRINFTKLTLMDFWVHAHNLILLRKIQKSDRQRSWWHLLVFFFLHLHLHTKRTSKKEDWPHSEMVQSGSIDFILKITLIHFANATSDSEGPCFVLEQSIFQSSASVSCPWLSIFANLSSSLLNRWIEEIALHFRYLSITSIDNIDICNHIHRLSWK